MKVLLFAVFHLCFCLVIVVSAQQKYIKIGRTWTQTVGSPQDYYATLNEQSYRTWVYQINNITGGIMVGGENYLIQDINYNDGADCTLMKLLYTTMITQDGVDFLFSPVQPNCPELALIAENYSIPYLNGADFTLPILMLTPDSGYNNLTWVFNTQQNLLLYGQSCATAITTPSNIQNPPSIGDATPNSGEESVDGSIVRTFVAAYNIEIPYLVPQIREALLSKNLTEVYPIQLWNLAEILSGGCTYLGPTIDAWIAAQPDLIVATSGASNTSILLSCLHEKLYQPRMLWLPVPDTDPTYPTWHSSGSIVEAAWVPTQDFTDPVFGSFSKYQTLYNQLWNSTGVSSYQVTITTTAVILTEAIKQAQSIDADLVLPYIRAFNMTTIYGPTFFQLENAGNYINRLVICTQAFISDTTDDNIQPTGNNITTYAVYPTSWPGYQKMIYPAPFFFPQYWKTSLSSSGLSQLAYAFIIFGSILGFLIIVGIGIALFVRWKYVTICFSKAEIKNTEADMADNWS